MCDYCDPTSPSPDPVVVRLEREVEEATKLMNTYAKKMVEADAENARLRGLLREAVEAADFDDDEWWGTEIPDEWFVRVKAVLEGTS